MTQHSHARSDTIVVRTSPVHRGFGGTLLFFARERKSYTLASLKTGREWIMRLLGWGAISEGYTSEQEVSGEDPQARYSSATLATCHLAIRIRHISNAATKATHCARSPTVPTRQANFNELYIGSCSNIRHPASVHPPKAKIMCNVPWRWGKQSSEDSGGVSLRLTPDQPERELRYFYTKSLGQFNVAPSNSHRLQLLEDEREYRQSATARRGIKRHNAKTSRAESGCCLRSPHHPRTGVKSRCGVFWAPRREARVTIQLRCRTTLRKLLRDSKKRSATTAAFITRRIFNMSAWWFEYRLSESASNHPTANEDYGSAPFMIFSQPDACLPFEASSGGAREGERERERRIRGSAISREHQKFRNFPPPLATNCHHESPPPDVDDDELVKKLRQRLRDLLAGLRAGAEGSSTAKNSS
ncbi:hypothetical protein B0H11DRAFT_2198160 [Mycena galericulata]|nr:hypothetical protein B0H11DRAFT_2198160 [Mycena galericulata]